ncbi:hypothetical protein Tco_1214862 [Tanacetum coccineum]
MLTNNSWVDGSGSNPGGGFGKSGGGRETRSGGGGLEGNGTNCPSLIHRGYLVKYVVEEVIEMDFDGACGGKGFLSRESKVVYEKCGEGAKQMVFEGDDYKVKVVKWFV